MPKIIYFYFEKSRNFIGACIFISTEGRPLTWDPNAQSFIRMLLCGTHKVFQF